jgi:hypothetical protein
LKRLSPDDKSTRRSEDASLDRLFDLDDEIMEVGQGYWVELRVKQVPVSEAKPHGIDYSLCLLGPDGTRLVCYDNAHAVKRKRGQKRARTSDHRHVRTIVKSYDYSNAETLMQDFWTDVERILKEEGVP